MPVAVTFPGPPELPRLADEDYASTPTSRSSVNATARVCMPQKHWQVYSMEGHACTGSSGDGDACGGGTGGAPDLARLG